MCRALMPGDEESMNDEAIWEALPVSSVELAISNMVVKISHKLVSCLINCFPKKNVKDPHDN